MNTNLSQQDKELLDSLGGSIEKPSSTERPGITSSIEGRALTLLGSGIPAESVAAALGVTPSRISQLMADPEFSEAVAKQRYDNLQEHNIRDSKYDSIEDKLLENLESKLPLMLKPADILRAIQIINGAKRRGQSSPEQVTNQQTIVNLLLPSSVAAEFTVNVNNQVIKAGEKELITMPSSQLLNQVEEQTKLLPPQEDNTQCAESINTDQEEHL